jgi:hypothetical protein
MAGIRREVDKLEDGATPVLKEMLVLLKTVTACIERDGGIPIEIETVRGVVARSKVCLDGEESELVPLIDLGGAMGSLMPDGTGVNVKKIFGPLLKGIGDIGKAWERGELSAECIANRLNRMVTPEQDGEG